MYLANHDELEILPEPLTSETYAIAIRKGNTELLQHVNKVIADMQASGKLEEIRTKYAAMQVRPPGSSGAHAAGTAGWKASGWT